MSVTIQVPTPLRTYVGGAAEVAVSGTTVGEAMRSLVTTHPALARHLYDGQGAMRSFVNIFLNDKNIRELAGEATAVANGDSLLIIPAIAGGRR